jgi:hypothetical protein
MDECLSQLVALAKAEYGESEFAYSKCHITWIWGRKRGQKGSHFMPIGPGEPTTREDYEANIEEEKRIRMEAFMGRWQKSYWSYEKKLTRPGWREKLVEIINNYSPIAEPNPKRGSPPFPEAEAAGGGSNSPAVNSAPSAGEQHGG